MGVYGFVIKLVFMVEKKNNLINQYKGLDLVSKTGPLTYTINITQCNTINITQ